MSVFISHADKDNADADRIHDALEAAGIEAWADHRDIKPGDDFNGSIHAAINERPNCVFVLSPNSAENKNTAAEYMRYLQKPDGRLYVVLTAPVPFNQFPWRLTTVQYVDLSKDFDTGMGSLINAIKGERLIRKEDPGAAQGLRLSGAFPYYHLDIPISGREADLGNVRDILAKEQRLLVLMAFGGTGKTRLAAELAITAKNFKDGVIWQTLDTGSKADSLTYLLRDHLDLPAETEAAETWNAVGGRQVLIILDNAESCTDRAAYAERLQNYPISGGTRVIMTSREQWAETQRFNRAYELAAPTLEAAEQIVKDMAEGGGFADQVAGHEHEFAEAARQHPRLIQYGIAWLQEFPLQGVLKLLSELKGVNAEAVLDDILHKTLEQIESQPGGEQAIADLKKLLVCKGGFTYEAAEAILGNVDSLGLLRRWNLLHLTAGRYTPDTLVEATLAPDPSAHPTHYDFYYALTDKHDKAQDYLGLDPESDNLEAAFERAMGAGEFEKAYWLGGNACFNFLANRGRFDQHKIWLEQAAEALQGHPDAELGAKVQISQGLMYQAIPTGNKQANLRRAIERYEAALDYWTPQNAPWNYAMTQANLGAAYWDLSYIEDREANLRRAIERYEAALVYWKPQAYPLDYARAQNNLGNAYLALAKIEDLEANLRRAIAAYEAALVYRTPQAAPLDYAQTQNNLGTAYNDLSKLEDREANLRRAFECYKAALVYRTPETAPLKYAQTQWNLGLLYEDLEDWAGAIHSWAESQKYYRQMGYMEDAETAKRQIAKAEARLGGSGS
jgi:tetratricopeptide (TPR) repeat protein